MNGSTDTPHLTPEDLERLLSQEVDSGWIRLLLHHLEVCPECGRTGGWILDLYRSGRLKVPFGPLDLALERSRAEAPALREEIAGRSAAERRQLMSGDAHVVSWGLAELLSKESERVAAQDAAQAVETRRRFEEAIQVLDCVIGIYLDGDQTSEDRHSAGRALIRKGFALAEMGNPESAIAILREAAPLVDAERDPRLVLCLRHNLLDNLSRVGFFWEAEEILPEVRGLSAEIGNRLDQVRLLWMEGAEDPPPLAWVDPRTVIVKPEDRVAPPHPSRPGEPRLPPAQARCHRSSAGGAAGGHL